MANVRGMHKVEFYSSLNEIKELYDQGYVVLKILYEEMKKHKDWEMSYWSFLKYAKRELPLKKSTKTQKEKETNDGSPIAKANFSTGKKWNPHTVDIPKDRIL